MWHVAWLPPLLFPLSLSLSLCIAAISLACERDCFGIDIESCQFAFDFVFHFCQNCSFLPQFLPPLSLSLSLSFSSLLLLLHTPFNFSLVVHFHLPFAWHFVCLIFLYFHSVFILVFPFTFLSFFSEIFSVDLPAISHWICCMEICCCCCCCCSTLMCLTLFSFFAFSRFSSYR